MMLWAPREYELFRLAEGGQAEQLLWRYLQQAPVSEGLCLASLALSAVG